MDKDITYIRTADQLKAVLTDYRARLILKSDDIRAAVAIIFMFDKCSRPRLIFIKRSEDPHDPWSGHMAFPGGRSDPADKDALATVYRETREEIGLDLEDAGQLLGQIDDIRAIARGHQLPMVISPFVFGLETDVILTANQEVLEIHSIPLDFFFDPSHCATVPYSMNGQRLFLPCYRYQERNIWGLTYRMLQNLFSVINPEP
ncbi:CoA pyrophosphatase [bacterium]|nr:CoA pyrophosphatase [bacterium]